MPNDIEPEPAEESKHALGREQRRLDHVVHEGGGQVLRVRTRGVVRGGIRDVFLGGQGGEDEDPAWAQAGGEFEHGGVEVAERELHVGEDHEDGVVGGARGLVPRHVGFEKCPPGDLPLGDFDHSLRDVDPCDVHAGFEEGFGDGDPGPAADVEDEGVGVEEGDGVVDEVEEDFVPAVLVLVLDVDRVEKLFRWVGRHCLRLLGIVYWIFGKTKFLVFIVSIGIFFL